MVKGQVDRLNSAFHLGGYNMILNFVKVEGISPDYMLERCLEARETVWRSILEIRKRFPDGIPLLDPIVN